MVGFCHCRMCQKASGNLFIVFADFPGPTFSYTLGEPTYYSPDPAIMLGCLDHPEDWPPNWEHSGIESKVPWYRISDNLPQSTTEESEFLKKARERKAPPRFPESA